MATRSILPAKAYLYLFIAIIAEVLGTSALKASDGFTRLMPSLMVLAAYTTAFYLLSLVFRSIPVGIAYAIWAGLGIVIISLVGVLAFRQALDLAAMVGIGMIVAGVVVINLFSKSAGH